MIMLDDLKRIIGRHTVLIITTGVFAVGELISLLGRTFG